MSKEDTRKLKYLLLKKIPDEYRIKLWMISSGALREKQNNPQYYYNLVNFPEGIPSPYENQIEMDLHRTFPHDDFFKEESSINALRNILLAYSRRNISVGYCQGFNFIVGRIYKITKNEENSFWIFVQLIESILPISYYVELTGIIVDTSILHILLKMYHPDLYSHLVEIGYDLSLNNILYKWFVSLFIQNTNDELSFIVWDSLFLEGNIVLFFASLALFRIMKLDMMQTESMEELHILLDEKINCYDDKYTMYWYCIIKKFEFDYNFLYKHRAEYEKSVTESILLANKKKIEILKAQKRQASYAKGVVMCQRDWPMCIYDLDYKYNNINNYLVLRRGDKINFVNDYFFNECNKKPYKCRSSGNIALSSIDLEYNISTLKPISKEPNKPFKLSIKSNKENAILSRRKESADSNLSNNNKKEEIENSQYHKKSTKVSKLTQTIQENQVKKKSFSKSPQRTSLTNNNEVMKYNAYMNLTIERREHICDYEEDIKKEEEEDIVKKLQKEAFMKKNAMSFVQDYRDYMRGNDKDLFNQTVNRVTLNLNLDKNEKKIMETFKDKSILDDYEFEI